MLSALSLPTGLCLQWRETSSPGPRYHSLIRTIKFPWGKAEYEQTGYLTHLGHEVCHAYQHQQALDAGLEDDANILSDWVSAPAGQSFVEATGWTFQDGTWVEEPEAGYYGYPHPVEDHAQLCAIWFDPATFWGNHDYLENFAPKHYAWAQEWLPAPP